MAAVVKKSLLLTLFGFQNLFPTFGATKGLNTNIAPVSWHQDFNDITYSLAIPDKGTAPFDIFLSITAPVSLSWVGLAIGGNMVGDPLVALWTTANSYMASPRWATEHSLPPVSNRTVANAYSSSHRNSTHWTINALCQNCSSWDGGAVYPNGTNTFGWAASDTPISNNASYDAQLQFHSRGYGRFQLDLAKARMPEGQWCNLTRSLGSIVGGSNQHTARAAPKLKH